MRRMGNLGGFVAWWAALSGCVTEDAAVIPKESASVAQPQIDSHRLCQLVGEIEDAQFVGQRSSRRAEYQAAEASAPLDEAMAFAAIFAIDDEQSRWKAFHEASVRNPAGVVGALGECFVYNEWKLADQAARPCGIAARSLGGTAVLDYAHARRSIRKGNTEEARSALTQALQKDADCLPVVVALANLEQSAGQQQAANERYATGARIAPSCFRCAFQQAVLTEELQGPQMSVPFWETALRLAPEHTESLQRYAAALVGKDDEKALVAYEKAMAAGRTDQDTLLAASKLSEKTGQLEKALTYTEQAVNARPDDVTLWRRIAKLAESKRDEARTESAWGEVLRLLPGDVSGHLALARRALKREQFLDALVHFDLGMPQAQQENASGGSDAAQALVTERDQLLSRLGVKGSPASGSIERVITRVQRSVRPVFEEQAKAKRGLKGTLQIVVVTDAEGQVTSVDVTGDELHASMVAAAVVAELKRAVVRGGAKRYALELDFE